MSQQTMQLALPVLLLVVFYFLLIRPQKKKEKQVNEMRKNIKIGDQIVTIGGIYGKVTKLKDEKITIEVGSDKTRFEVTRWAISSVLQEGKGQPDKKDNTERPDEPEQIENKDSDNKEEK